MYCSCLAVLHCMTARLSIHSLSQPIDTVKSRIQIKQRKERSPIFNMFVEVVKEEGVRGLY